ncbi:lipoate--protein ligase [Paludicola sp. MB14-C6]|uniref:lipoate--protein ligase n=1 Tax=Paludihabitans sp. MB14-C6 TaxID=3070656 RepID=UPI0027DD4805|nr:lipoate--protein ligase [Paludicola sp. MB14-C6]WMJ22726.1 lipoate--protein ligase [Paludicola sp. MB14-C6]
MNKVFISNEFDPYFNIAAENQLFLESDEDIHLYLWQNDASVIIGRNQNLYAECNLTYMKEHNIKPVRRFSGGGAVYHDKGNVNFTFITKEKKADQNYFLRLIQAAVAKLGIDCKFSGRNDLLYQGQKFSGHAYFTDDDNYMYHGTILVNVDSNQLTKALTPSKLKLESKGIASVKSRVVNLSTIDSKITAERVKQAFIDAFQCESIAYIDQSNFKAPLQNMLSSDEWLFNQSPAFGIKMERKLPCGNVSAHVDTSDGVIQNIKINTDSLNLYHFEACEKELIGKTFHEDIIWKCIQQYISKP